jgi:hypothetical protein
MQSTEINSDKIEGFFLSFEVRGIFRCISKYLCIYSTISRGTLFGKSCRR